MTPLLVIAFLTLAGLPIVHLTGARSLAAATRVALAFLYGCGAIYVVLLAFALLEIRWTLINTSAAVLLIACASFVLRRFVPSNAGRQQDPSPLRWSWIDLLTIAVLIVYGRYALAGPATHWDFWSIWGLKGRVFYEARGIDWRFLSSPWTQFSHPDYPVLVPLNYAYLALANGAWSDRWIGELTMAFGVALLVIVRMEMTRETSSDIAAATALIATAFALSPQIGLAEAPLIASGGAGLILIRNFVRTENEEMVRHGSILLGLAAATKNEGITLCVAAGLALLLSPARRHILKLWPAAAVALPWMAIRSLRGLQTDLASPGMLQRVEGRLLALPQMFSTMAEALSNPALWMIMIIAMAISFRRVRSELFMLVAVAAQLLFFVLAYLATPLDAAWHIASSFGRISAQLAVPFLYATVVLLSRYVTSRQAESAPTADDVRVSIDTR